MIETDVPYSDGWWLKKLYAQLRVQERECEALHKRYKGDSPLPMVATTQSEAVRWFVEKARGNLEMLIVKAVLSRMKIAGVRTAVDSGEGGDAEAYKIFRTSHGKLWARDVIKYMLSMRRGYVIVGKDEDGLLQVTAEDPRMTTAITDPANPYKVLAALKMYHDDVADQDILLLYVKGRLAVAKRDRKARVGSAVQFIPSAYEWDGDWFDGEQMNIQETEGWGGSINELSSVPDLPDLCPVVEFVNEDMMAQFEPFVNQIDRIHQQILQRMTIATIQAFRQRAFKGLPTHDPKTSELIDWNAVFLSDPGAIWNMPKDVEIQELGQADFQQILLAVRDDMKDLAASSGTPLYSISPDAANGSAEGASLQRESNTAVVEEREDRTEPSFEKCFELIFRTLGDLERSVPGTIEVIWAPIVRPSMGERANAIAQTTGVLSKTQQVTEIWGMDPAQAARNATELVDDLIQTQQYGTPPAALPAAPKALDAPPTDPAALPAPANAA